MSSILIVLSLLTLSPFVSSTYEICSWRFRGNPEDCNSYFQCNFGQALLRQCPEGLHWNSHLNTCDWARSALCDPGLVEFPNNLLEDDREFDSTCGISGVGFVPHPDDCGKYYVCNHGTLLEMSCTPPLLWNPTHNTCDWPDSAGCQTNKPSITGTTARPVVGPPAPPDETEEGQTSQSPVPTPPPTIEPAPPTTNRPTPPTTARPRPTTNRPSGSTIVGIITGPPMESTTVVGPPAPPDQYDGDILQPSDQGYKVVCYFTGWAWYRPEEGKFKPSDVEPKLCTHIIYAFAVLDSNTWTIRPADTWADLDNEFYKQVTGFKKNGRKVTIAVGGWNDSGGQKYSLLLRDLAKLQTFISSVVTFVKEYNFDGVDLDYEYPGCPNGECNSEFASDKSGFLALVRGLREALPPGSILSAAVSCNKNIIDEGYDVPTLSKYLDWFGVMDYDIHGAWEGETGHIAPLYPHPSDKKEFLNVDYSIKYWISKGAPPSKLVMGIPFYGQSFRLTNPNQTGIQAPTAGPGLAGKATRQPGVLAFYEICSTEWTLKVEDKEGRMGPYVVRDNQWVSYDDVAAVNRKTEYVKQMGLGGAMVWALDFDDFRNRCGKGKYPLLNAITASFHTDNSSTRLAH